jgi:HEAT repeat protein
MGLWTRISWLLLWTMAGIPVAGQEPMPLPVPGIRALPPGTLATVVWHGTQGREAEVLRTGLARLLRTLDDEERNPLTELLRRLAPLTGTELDDWEILGRRPATVALTSFYRGQPDWLVVSELGEDAPKASVLLERAVEQVRRLGLQPRSELWDKTPLWTVWNGQRALLSWILRGDVLIVARDQQSVEMALRRRDTPGDSMAQDPLLRELLVENQRSGPLLTCHLRPVEMLRAFAAQAGDDSVKRLNLHLDVLQLHRVRGVGLCLDLDGGVLRQRLRVQVPVPRPPLLATLFEPKSPVGQELLSRVPADAASCTVLRLATGELGRQIVHWCEQTDLGAQATLQAWQRTLRDAAGIDFNRDLFGPLGDEVLLVQWPAGADGTPDFAVLLSLHDGAHLRHALTAWMRECSPPLGVTQAGDRTVYHLLLQSLPLGTQIKFCVGDRLLIAASCDAALERTLRWTTQPTVNARVAAAGRPVTSAATTFSWSALRTAPLVSSLLLSDPIVEERALLSAVGRRLLAISAESVTTGAADAAGLTWECRSPVGDENLLTLLAVAAARTLRAIEPDLPRGTSPDAEAPIRMLEQIARAQEQYRAQAASDGDGDGRGEYGSLQQLVASRLLEGTDYGGDPEAGSVAAGRYRLTILLPLDVEGRELRYTSVLWPSGARTGRVLVRDEQGNVHRNDLIASVRGIKRLTVTDVYGAQAFGTLAGAGWEQVQDASPTPDGTRTMPAVAATSQPTSTIDDRRAWDVILEAEKAGSPRVPRDVLDALRSSNPAVAARAARAIGVLHVVDGVPALCEIVQSDASLDLRRHALDALVRLRDPRSVRASLHALRDPDATLRALAARNLGSLRCKEAMQPMLEILAQHHGDGPDDTQVLLALADYGDPSVLSPVGGSVRGEDKETGNALGYLFERLSSSLEPDVEGKLLIASLGHPSATLRRFAIERLGQVGDAAAIRALEGRLAQETDALRPLIEVSLRTLRGPSAGAEGEGGFLQRIEHGFVTVKAKTWDKLDARGRSLAAAGASGLLTLLLVLLAVRRRHRRAQQIANYAALVQPSEDYVAPAPRGRPR